MALPAGLLAARPEAVRIRSGYAADGCLHSPRACTPSRQAGTGEAMNEAQILSVILLFGVMIYLVFTTR